MFPDTKQINFAITSILEELFPDIYAACITGSYVDRNFNTESDIDLWLLSYHRDYIFHETIIKNSFKIQCTHIPLSKIEELLWYDFKSNNGAYFNAFGKAVIFKDTGNFLFDLIKKCNKIFLEGPEQLSPFELQQKKDIVLNDLSDFKGNQSNEESIIILNELLNNFIVFYLHYNRNWFNGGGRYLSRTLKKINPGLHIDLFKSYNRYFHDLNKQPIINFITGLMSNFEGIQTGFTKSHNKIVVKENYFIIQFFKIPDYFRFIEKRLMWVIDSLKDNIDNYFFFRTRAIGDSTLNYESLYFIGFSPSAKLINEKVLPILNSTLLKNQKGLNVNFPINLNLSILFGGENFITPFSNWLGLLSKTNIENGLNESKSFIFSLKFFKMIGVYAFKNDAAEFYSFLVFIQESWFTHSFDRGIFFHIDQLRIEKENVVKVFEAQFYQQKHALQNIMEDEQWEKSNTDLVAGFKGLINLIERSDFSHFQHPVINSIIPHPNWTIYTKLLKAILTVLFVPENQMCYIPYCMSRFSHLNKILPK
jgi:hypothetical protein